MRYKSPQHRNKVYFQRTVAGIVIIAVAVLYVVVVASIINNFL